MADVNLTLQEQLVLELVNRARLDPSGEAARLGIDLNQGLPAGTLNGTAKQPLAPNGFLVDAARKHSQWMIDTDVFSHTGAGGSSPAQRMQAAGYVLTGSSGAGENIAVRGTSGTINLNAMAVQLHEDLFRSPGHRENLLLGSYRELGTGLAQGPFQFDSGLFNSATLTEKFAFSGTARFVTGVAITDADGDNFYDIGEARAGVTVSVSAAGIPVGSDTTEPAGGYSVATAGGTLAVTFSGGGLAGSVSVTVVAGSQNAKVDLLGANEILSSASATLGAGAVQLGLLGVANLNGTGNGIGNVISGNKGANILSGMLGNDTLRGFAGADTLKGGPGVDVLTGGLGRDILIGGSERDVFDFNLVAETGKTGATRDIISDFVSLLDDIDLSGIDAKSTVAGNQAFKFIFSQPFHGVAGELRFVKVDLAGIANDRTIVSGDVNGDRVADFEIHLVGAIDLKPQDFIL